MKVKTIIVSVEIETSLNVSETLEVIREAKPIDKRLRWRIAQATAMVAHKTKSSSPRSSSARPSNAN